MKIYQFMPNPLSPAPEKTSAEKSRSGAESTPGKEADFAQILKAASSRPPQTSPGPGSVVSLENRRASQSPSAVDLGQAGRLLSSLNQDIRSATPEMLKSVHDLEGLVYVYSKNQA